MEQKYGRKFYINDRNLSVAVFSLYFSWLLAFPFEGQILYTIADSYHLAPHEMIFSAIAVHFAGLLMAGFFVKSMRAAKRLMLGSILFSIIASCFFFFPPSIMWKIAIITSSFLAGASVAAWGFYLKTGTPVNQRIRTVADGLIYSNLLMIILNMASIHLSPFTGLGLSIAMLGLAFLSALRLSDGTSPAALSQPEQDYPVNIKKPLFFLYLFVLFISINSGLMYQVLNPAFTHLKWLTSWYWAIPYISALYIMRSLPRQTNRTYILYVAIAMIGFSFIAFIGLDRSAISYFVVNTLMLGACGIYDLFWWSILGEMLDMDENPAKVLGIGLSANVLGVLLGGLIGNTIASAGIPVVNSTLLALAVVCVTLVILPPLHKNLSALLKDHVYLTTYSAILPGDQDKVMNSFINLEQLTEREKEIASLLLKGKTYRMIAGELHVSENTVKTHVKNIYAKLKIQNRTELINLALGQQIFPHS